MKKLKLILNLVLIFLLVGIVIFLPLDTSITGMAVSIPEDMSSSIGEELSEMDSFVMANNELIRSLNSLNQNSNSLSNYLITSIFYSKSKLDYDKITCSDYHLNRWNSVNKNCNEETSAACINDPWYSIYQKCKGLESCSETFTVSSKKYPAIACRFGLTQLEYKSSLEMNSRDSANSFLGEKSLTSSVGVSTDYISQIFNKFSNLEDNEKIFATIVSYHLDSTTVENAIKKSGSNKFTDYFFSLSNDQVILEETLGYLTRVLLFSFVFEDFNLDGRFIDYYEKLEDDFDFESPDMSKISTGFGENYPTTAITLPYTIDDYDLLRSDVENIVGCTGKEDIKNCVEKKLNELNNPSNPDAISNFEIEYGPYCLGTSDEINFYDFVDSLKRCAESYELGVCPNLRNNKAKISLVKTNFGILLSDDVRNLNLDDINLEKEGYNYDSGKIRLTGIMGLIYQHGYCFANIGSNTIGLLPCDEKECSVEPKKEFRFCAQTEDKIRIYNKEREEYETVYPNYKFAIDFDMQKGLSFKDTFFEDNVITFRYELNDDVLVTKVLGVEDEK